MTPAIRAALIGYGLGGRSFHAPFLATTPGLTLACIVTSNPERRAQAAAEHASARILSSADELFAAPDAWDLVVISTPNRSHVPLALRGIDAGLAVVVDKPLAASVEDGRRVVDAARRRGVMLTVYQNRRWDGDFLTVQALVREQELGAVHRFESRFERWRPGVRRGWRDSDDPADAGGLLYDIGTHLIDQALCLFGPVTGVHAELDQRRAGVAVDDDVFVALTHASGTRSHLWASLVAAQNGPRFRLLGSRAAFTKFGMDVQEEALRRGDRPDAPDWGIDPRDRWGRLTSESGETVVPTRRGAYHEFYAGVVRALHGGARPPVDPADALATLEIIERAAQGQHGAIPGRNT